jgi:hypothetical protein
VAWIALGLLVLGVLLLALWAIRDQDRRSSRKRDR